MSPQSWPYKLARGGDAAHFLMSITIVIHRKIRVARLKVNIKDSQKKYKILLEGLCFYAAIRNFRRFPSRFNDRPLDTRDITGSQEIIGRENAGPNWPIIPCTKG